MAGRQRRRVENREIEHRGQGKLQRIAEPILDGVTEYKRREVLLNLGRGQAQSVPIVIEGFHQLEKGGGEAGQCALKLLRARLRQPVECFLRMVNQRLVGQQVAGQGRRAGDPMG